MLTQIMRKHYLLPLPDQTLVVQRAPVRTQREERPRVEGPQKTIHVCQPGDVIEYRDTRRVDNGELADRKRELYSLTNSEVPKRIERCS